MRETILRATIDFWVPGKPESRLEPSAGMIYKKGKPRAIVKGHPKNEIRTKHIQKYLYQHLATADPKVQRLLEQGPWGGVGRFCRGHFLWTFPHTQESRGRKSTLHNVKPDEDNLAKLVWDALKGVVLTDDAVSTGGRRKKQRGEEVGTRIIVELWEEGDVC